MEHTLDAVRKDLISHLERAASDRRSPMHTPVVATPDGGVRIMVLRHFDPASWTLRFHTDARAPKAVTIGQGAKTGVLFYDREDQLQIRIEGKGRIVTQGNLVDAAWQESDAYARRCYLGEPPSLASDHPTSGLPPEVEGERPSEEQLAPARENFAVLLIEIGSADWYHLAHDGHRRALLRPDGTGNWLTP